MSSYISSRVSADRPSRPGAGRCLAVYKMPDFAGSKGVPASSVSYVPEGRPHCAAIASNRLPRASVAEVSTTVCSPNRFSRSICAIDSGATASVSVPSNHTTSSCAAGSSVAKTSKILPIASARSVR